MDTIRGYIENFIHQNPVNGYNIFVLVDKGRETTCIGNSKDLQIGETVELTGEFFEDPVYGKEFRIKSYKVVPPADNESIERYLGSGAIKGIGQALAARIVSMFGKDTLRIIEEEPERLAEVKGISVRRAMEIAVQVEEKRDLRDAMMFLGQYDISQALSVKIFDTYGQGLYTVMKENPYKLAEDISGVGFITADTIARRVGIPENSPMRLRCALLYIMQQSAGEGHCYLPIPVLFFEAKKMLGMDDETIKNELQNLALDRKLIIREENVYLSAFFYAEQNCARLLDDLSMPLERLTTEEEEILQGRLKTIADAQNMEVDPVQLEAVKECVKNSIFILSGGPGTGR